MTKGNVPIARLGGISSLAAFITDVHKQLVVPQALSFLPEHSYNNLT
jgi:hypothetical protein